MTDSNGVEIGARASCIVGKGLEAISLLNSNFFDSLCHIDVGERRVEGDAEQTSYLQ